MRHGETFSDLIGGIYDAAIDPALWPDVLSKISAFVGGQSAGLVSTYVSSRVINVHYHSGCNPHYLELYREQYWRFDPLAPLPLFDVGEVLSARDHMPDAEFGEGRFYQEWMRPQGLLDTVSVVLEKSVTSSAVLAFVRSEASGPVGEQMRRRVHVIVPHVRRAMLIGKVIDLRQAEAVTFADTLDGLSAGVFLVEAGGGIVHSNAAGKAILADGDWLQAVGGRLMTGASDQALQAQILLAANSDAELAVGDRAVPLVSREGERFLAHVLPLASGTRRRAGTATTAVAAVFVHKAGVAGPLPTQVIARHFGLTPTELRVLLAIVEVGGGPEAAEVLGIAPSTVKTHLSRLYQKTGVGRQADLVKLMAEFSSPLLG
jgi:DNA-binding CsgD family transcriptional regulator